MNETLQEARERYQYIQALNEGRGRAPGGLGELGGRGYQASPQPQGSPDEVFDPEEEAYANEPIGGPPPDQIPPHPDHEEHLMEPGGGDQGPYRLPSLDMPMARIERSDMGHHIISDQDGTDLAKKPFRDPRQAAMWAKEHGIHIREGEDMPEEESSPMQEAMGKFVEGLKEAAANTDKDEYSTKAQVNVSKADKKLSTIDGADDGKPPLKPSEIGMEKMKKFAEGCQQMSAPTSKTFTEAKSDFVKNIQKHAKR